MEVARLARLASISALALTFVAATCVWALGPLGTPNEGMGQWFGLYLDRLSATMFVLVSFIGLIVVSYSRNYLDGDPRHGQFLQRLSLTLASVLFLIVSGTLVQFALAWIATSLSLHRLLLFYGNRQAAVLAARKKFFASRLSDAALIGSFLILHQALGSQDFGTLLVSVKQMPPHASVAIQVASLLMVLAALLKSAQLPLHGWLIEVMETPTPVSALLHAGIINAGGFLILRFSEIVSHSAGSLEVLTVVGAITALFGSLVMLTQTSVKVSLAYSTIGQMGFMMLECGLGAFPAALLHIIGHSLYKAHAFLSSGSVIDLARAAWTPGPGGKPHPARTAFAVVLLLAGVTGVGLAFGATILTQPGVFTLAAIVLLGLTHLVSNAMDERLNAYVMLRTLGIAIAVAVSYFAIQGVMELLFTGSLPPNEALRGPFDLIIIAVVLMAFSITTIFQNQLGGLAQRPFWQAFYVHLSHGLYVNTLANRWALRFWPMAKGQHSDETSPLLADKGVAQ
jgi:NAD(P)H-quinone oxidoreductase subunit 5